MANKHRGENTINIGGKHYLLRFDVNALVELERLLGGAFGPKTLEKGQITAIRDALYCGIKHSDRRLTPDRVGRMMEMSELAYYADTIAETMGLALGVDEADGEAGAKADPLVADLDG